MWRLSVNTSCFIACSDVWTQCWHSAATPCTSHLAVWSDWRNIQMHGEALILGDYRKALRPLLEVWKGKSCEDCTVEDAEADEVLEGIKELMLYLQVVWGLWKSTGLKYYIIHYIGVILFANHPSTKTKLPLRRFAHSISSSVPVLLTAYTILEAFERQYVGISGYHVNLSQPF